MNSLKSRLAMFFPIYSTIFILWYIQNSNFNAKYNGKWVANRNFHKCKRQNLTYFESSPWSWSMASFEPSEVARTSRFDCNRSLAFSWIRSFFSSSASKAEFNWSNWASRALKAKKKRKLIISIRFLESKIYALKVHQIRELSFIFIVN